MNAIEWPSISRIKSRIEQLGILPVVELADANRAEPLFEALMRGGLPGVEITLRTREGIEALSRLVRAYPDALIGAGTIRSAEDVARVIDVGASFVVCPATDMQLIELCSDRRVMIIPGVCTPTEVHNALKWGVSLVKFFPAESGGGVPFLKSMAGPFRDVRFVPTGGINAGNLSDYLSLGSVAACGGSWMVSPDLLASGDFERVAQLAAEAVAIVAAVRARRAGVLAP